MGFSLSNYLSPRGCHWCCDWDIFDPRPVSDSLSQNLCLKKKYLPQLNCELSGSWPKKCSKTSIFRIVPRKSAICGIRPPVFSNSLPMNRSRYFRSVDCFWKFDGKTPHEKLFTTPAQSWTLWRPVENGCLKMPWFAPILGPLRPVFGTCYGKVVGMFFCKTAFCKVIFY